MKKILIIAALLAATSLQAQKQDTTIHIVLPLETYRQLLSTLDKVIDSKQLSKELFDLFQKNTTIYDKPKEVTPIKK